MGADRLWLVRHGESAGNLARDAAEASGAEVICLATRDVDVPLSPLGERQARAVGRWFGALPADVRPTLVMSSPYLRARDTAGLLLEAAGSDFQKLPLVIDERLREREFGILDGLTTHGIEQQYPEQARMRASVGKFYHRPPGGESWCDVILRLRGVVDTIARDHRDARVLLICHQAVIFCLRYLLENMTEEEILAIDRTHQLANCSVTEYARDSGSGHAASLSLTLFNLVAPLEEAGAVVTREPDARMSPR